MEISYAAIDAGALPLVPGQTLRIAGRKGLTVRCLCGQVWLTQYGVADDFFLPGGASYCSSGDGLILVNAWGQPSAVAVSEAPARPWLRIGPVAIESFERMDRQARLQRAQAVAQILARAWRRFVWVLKAESGPPDQPLRRASSRRSASSALDW